VVARAGTDTVRIAELTATLSYASDLGLGQPMAHCVRQTVVALRLAGLAGASGRELEATYYLGLMMNVYCHADAAEQALWFGDHISMKSDVRSARHEHGADGRVHGAAGRLARQRRGPRPAASGVPGCRDEAGDLLASYPSHLRGEEICLPARLVQLAGPVDVVARRRGVEAAVAVTPGAESGAAGLAPGCSWRRKRHLAAAMVMTGFARRAARPGTAPRQEP